MMRYFLLPILCFTTLSSAAFALPQQVETALENAYKTNDQFVIRAVKDAALKQYPGMAEDIERHTSEVALKSQKAKAAKKAKANKSTSPWKGNVELGLNFSTGNSKKEDLNAATSLTYEGAQWGNTTALKAYTSKEEGVRSDEEYRVENQTRYKLSDINYTFLELEYVNDRFSGFESRTTENIGYGHYFWKEDDFKLSGEASAGARQSKLTNGTKENSFIQKLTGKMNWQITDSISFSEKLSTTIGSDTTVTESDSAIKTKAAENLYLKLGLNVEHVSDVPADRKNTDTTTSFGVVYDF